MTFSRGSLRGGTRDGNQDRDQDPGVRLYTTYSYYEKIDPALGTHPPRPHGPPKRAGAAGDGRPGSVEPGDRLNRGPQSVSNSSTIRRRVAWSGSRPLHAPMLSTRCSGSLVAGIAQVTAGWETMYLRKN